MRTQVQPRWELGLFILALDIGTVTRDLQVQVISVRQESPLTLKLVGEGALAVLEDILTDKKV